MTGSDWSLIGVAVSVVGALIAAYGQRLSGQEAKNRSEQLVAKSEELVVRTSEVATKSDEIAKLNREIADLSQKYAAYVMGEGSYFYLHVRGFGGAIARAEIKHVGPNPVRDTEILIFDVTDQIGDLAARRTRKYDLDRAPRQRFFAEASYAGRANMLNAQPFAANPDRDNYAYFVNLQGANGTYRQIIQLRRVGNEWKQGYVVQRVLVDDKFEPVGQFFDEGFPENGESIVRPAPGFHNLQ